MTTMKLLTAAAIATSLMATPVLAKDQTKHRAKAQADYSAQMNDDGYGDGAYQNGMRTSDSGFWPGDVATGVVGGAVGVAGAAVNTAGNIATAPFRGWDNSYAYYNGPTDRYDSRDSYARRNNFVCQPGTWFRGEDGQRHICQ